MLDVKVKFTKPFDKKYIAQCNFIATDVISEKIYLINKGYIKRTKTNSYFFSFHSSYKMDWSDQEDEIRNEILNKFKVAFKLAHKTDSLLEDTIYGQENGKDILLTPKQITMWQNKFGRLNINKLIKEMKKGE